MIVDNISEEDPDHEDSSCSYNDTSLLNLRSLGQQLVVKYIIREAGKDFDYYKVTLENAVRLEFPIIAAEPPSLRRYTKSQVELPKFLSMVSLSCCASSLLTYYNPRTSMYGPFLCGLSISFAYMHHSKESTDVAQYSEEKVDDIIKWVSARKLDKHLFIIRKMKPHSILNCTNITVAMCTVLSGYMLFRKLCS